MKTFFVERVYPAEIAGVRLFFGQVEIYEDDKLLEIINYSTYAKDELDAYLQIKVMAKNDLNLMEKVR